MGVEEPKAVTEFGGKWKPEWRASGPSPRPQSQAALGKGSPRRFLKTGRRVKTVRCGQHFGVIFQKPKFGSVELL